MVTAELVYEKAKQLDHSTLELLIDFMEFIANQRKTFQDMIAEKRKYFPETQFTSPTDKPAHTKRTLSIEDMNAAVDYEAGKHL